MCVIMYWFILSWDAHSLGVSITTPFLCDHFRFRSHHPYLKEICVWRHLMHFFSQILKIHLRNAFWILGHFQLIGLVYKENSLISKCIYSFDVDRSTLTFWHTHPYMSFLMDCTQPYDQIINCTMVDFVNFTNYSYLLGKSVEF